MTTGTTQDSGAPTAEPHRSADGPRLRASDADRSATVGLLEHAIVLGLLTPDEGSDRMATTFAARFRDELPAITADLPPVASPVPVAAVGWRALGTGLVAQVRYEVGATRAAGVRSQRFLVAVLVAVLLVGVLFALFGVASHGLFDAGLFDGGPVDGRHGH